MNVSKNQNGFATIEIISVCAIIAILFSVAVPKLGKIIDKVELDCATKKLYGDVRFAQNVNRLSIFNSSIFNDRLYKGADKINFFVNATLNYYELRRTYDYGDKIIRERKKFRNGMRISSNTGIVQKIDFDSSGISSFSGHIELTSRRGNKVNMYFNSVGRVHGFWEIHK